MKKLLYAAVVLLYFSACTPDKFETIKVDNLYSLDVPSYMKKTNDLNKEASLQYSNTLKRVYVLVIEENIDNVKQFFIDNGLTSKYTTDLNGYTKLLLEDSTANIKNRANTPIKDETINGLAAKTTKMECSIEGANFYYELAYVQGKQYYYQVIAWTPASRKDKNKNILERMTHSFKEL